MKEKILIVEDEPIISLGLKNLLEEVQYQAVIAKSADEALKLFKANQDIELAIVDIKIEGSKNGIETAKEMRKIRELPIIFLTAFAQDEIVKEVEQNSPALFLTKPYKPKELIYNVQLALAAKRSRTDWFENSDFKMFSKDVGMAMKKRRKAMGLTQAIAAEKAGVNYRHYQDIEGGKINIRLDTFFNLLRFYKIDFEEIFTANRPT